MNQSDIAKHSKSLITLLLSDMKALSICLQSNTNNKKQAEVHREQQRQNYSNQGKQSIIQYHNKLINNLLTSNDKTIIINLKNILSHYLHICDHKMNYTTQILSIINKIITFLINQDHIESLFHSEGIQQIIFHIIDIIYLLKNHNQNHIKIIQTTFALIHFQLLKFMEISLILRLYSICFQCCFSNTVVQNISVSALFILTETLFQRGQPTQYHSILLGFLEYLTMNKKYSWMKGGDLKGLVWDLTIVAIKNSQIEPIHQNAQLCRLLNVLYKISIDKSFTTEELSTPDRMDKLDPSKSINFKKDSISDFIRSYKLFVYFSIYLSITCKQEIVPFSQNIQRLTFISDIQRNHKMYIGLEGVCIILLEAYDIALKFDKGIVLLEILSKISQELCLYNQTISVSWQAGDLYLDKMCGDFMKISNGDFVRVIRNTLVALRKKYENIQSKNAIQTNNILKNQSRNTVELTATLKSRWSKMICTIIKTIRYLASINMQVSEDQQPVRKLILEYQNWFLICPTVKTRNLILQELLLTCSKLRSRQHAIKISQCVQIGSNLIYGYYNLLDSLGLTILIKMMAAIKADRDENRAYEQLNEVFLMSQKLYKQQNIVKSHQHYTITIQAFIQCANSLLADIQQPPTQDQNRNRQKHIRMLIYILQKLNIVISNNSQFIESEWNFLTGFWMSFCSSKNEQIQSLTIKHINEVIINLLQIKCLTDKQILSLYLQLTKCKGNIIHKQIILQIKSILSLITSQTGILQIFKIIKILNSYKLQQITHLQQDVIKDLIHKVHSTQSLNCILNDYSITYHSKNDQYKAISLLWSISDHIKTLYDKNIDKTQYEPLWKILLLKMFAIFIQSTQPQTKQSAMHTCTQIIAQISPYISKKCAQQCFDEVICKMFMLLIGINKTSQQGQAYKPNSDQLSHYIQMVKTAVKYYIKIVKKFIKDNHMKATMIKFTLQTIIQYIKQETNIPIEFYLQICVLINSFKDQSLQKYIDKIQINQMLKLIATKSQTLDQKTICFRKKFQPLHSELCQYYAKEQTQPNGNYQQLKQSQ